MTASAIRATFSDWRTVKSRKALQLVFEVPLERQAEVLTVLGAPMPDVETWVGIARLVPQAEDHGGAPKFNPAAQARYRALPDPEKAVARAAMHCADGRFQEWVSVQAGWSCDEDDCADWLRIRCGVTSRREIASNPGALETFLAIELEYQQAVGLTAEVR